MKTPIVLYTILLLAVLSCRKDKPIPVKIEMPSVSSPSTPTPPCIGDYNLYSNDTFSFVQQHLIPYSILQPSYEFPDSYFYSNPVFNPNNPYEIIYVKKGTNQFGLGAEIWKFSFCTGETKLIANDFYYNLDWGCNGWVIYTGTGHRIYKIKDNGDSLTTLSTQAGYNRAGKWNPSGKLYWNYRDDGSTINDENGNVIKNIAYKPLAWINDSVVLTQSTNFYLYSYNIYSDVISLLNSSWATSSSPVIYDKDKNSCYIPTSFGIGQDDYFLKYDLNGSNSVDTIMYLYDSYMFGGGDIANDKIITTLSRQSWKDTVQNIQNVQINVLIMDLDATNKRIVNLP